MARSAAASEKASQTVTQYDGKSLTFHRGYEKQIFVLSALRTMLNQELHKPVGDMIATVETFRQRDGCMSCGGEDKRQPSCSYQPILSSDYAVYHASMEGDWENLRRALSDLYDFSRPWLQQIHDQSVAKAEQARLDEFAFSFVGAYASALAVAGGEAQVAWNYHPAGSCEAGYPHMTPLKNVKPYPIDGTKCRTPPIVMPGYWVQMSANCDAISTTLGIGPLTAGVQYKFPPDYVFQNGVYQFNGGSDGQWTISAGGNLSAGFGPVAGQLSEGPFVTFQGGNMIDYGTDASASIGIKAATMPDTDSGEGYGGISGKLSENVRIGAVEGIEAQPASLGISGSQQ